VVHTLFEAFILVFIAVEYKEKIPSPIRDSYSGFRKNLGEPWNAVNQLIQGRPGRAAKTLGRFTINTVTTLGFADPASRLGLETEDENFGTTLGYWGVPSGPYLVLPIFGPSTFRDGFGLVVDGYARPQRYILEDEEGLYWAEQTLRGICSATVFGPSAEIANGYSTSIMVLGVEEGLKLLELNPEYCALIITDKGKIIYSKNFKKSKFTKN
jgi:ABC-type transporter lipoprotein component MlaA